MAAVPGAHPGPWTVEDLYALPEDGMRHELLDGILLVGPPPAVPHQLAARRLTGVLTDAAPVEVEVLEGVGVRLPEALLVPDVVVAHSAAVHAGTRELLAVDLLLAVEIVSPSSLRADRRWKPEIYAEGGIPCYWRIELQGSDSPFIVAYELSAGTYVEVARASGHQALRAAAPFAVEVVPSSLVGPRRGIT